MEFKGYTFPGFINYQDLPLLEQAPAPITEPGDAFNYFKGFLGHKLYEFHDNLVTYLKANNLNSLPISQYYSPLSKILAFYSSMFKSVDPYDDPYLSFSKAFNDKLNEYIPSTYHYAGISSVNRKFNQRGDARFKDDFKYSIGDTVYSLDFVYDFSQNSNDLFSFVYVTDNNDSYNSVYFDGKGFAPKERSNVGNSDTTTDTTDTTDTTTDVQGLTYRNIQDIEGIDLSSRGVVGGIIDDVVDIIKLGKDLWKTIFGKKKERYWDKLNEQQKFDMMKRTYLEAVANLDATFGLKKDATYYTEKDKIINYFTTVNHAAGIGSTNEGSINASERFNYFLTKEYSIFKSSVPSSYQVLPVPIDFSQKLFPIWLDIDWDVGQSRVLRGGKYIQYRDASILSTGTTYFGLPIWIFLIPLAYFLFAKDDKKNKKRRK